MPLPGAKSAGPIWSRKTKGPTMRRSAAGRTRATVNPPRSRGRGAMIASIASGMIGSAMASSRGSELDQHGGEPADEGKSEPDQAESGRDDLEQDELGDHGGGGHDDRQLQGSRAVFEFMIDVELFVAQH